MNEEYLTGLHQHLGINDDYNTWINAVKDNDDYLSKLHASLGIDDNFKTWKSSIMGKTVDPQTTDVDVDPAAVSSDTDLTSESTSSGLQSIYKTVDWFGKEQDGQPSRDKLIEEWQNTLNNPVN